MARKPDLPCAECGNLMWRGSTSAPEGKAKCLPCRRSSGVAHGTYYAYKRRGCRCDECRLANNEQQRAYSARVRQRDGLSPTQKYRKRAPKVSCHYCGTVLKTGATQNSEGVPRCKPCGRERRYAQERRERRQRRAMAKLAKAAMGVPANPRWPWVSGTCTCCGSGFTRRGAASSYCSSECRRKDQPKGQWISRSGRLAIYERDGWICQLCFDPVDPNLHYLDDWAASLDHIECRAWALIPDHSPTNLRLAHRWCNAVRGDESYYTDTDLRAA